MLWFWFQKLHSGLTNHGNLIGNRSGQNAIVKRFLTSKHPCNRTVITIWHYKMLTPWLDDFVANNFLKALKNIRLSTGFDAHIWDMKWDVYCKIQFASNLHTEYFHSFRGRYDCIINIYHQILNITTMGWNQCWLDFFRISLQRSLFERVHKKNNSLS